MRSFLLTIILTLIATISFAANSVTLQWEASPTPDVGYVIYYGQTPDALTYSVNVGDALTTTISDLPPGDWYFAATAYNEIDQSAQSNQVTTSFAAYEPPADVAHEPIVVPLPPGGTVTITVTP